MVPGTTSTSNIYISITSPRSNGSHEGYRRAVHNWLVSVEPHHHSYTHVPGTSRKEQEPVHYAATRDKESGGWVVREDDVVAGGGEGQGIIGNILVVEAGHVSVEKVREILEEDLGKGSSGVKSKDGESTTAAAAGAAADDDEEPEHWIRRALHSLQERGIAQPFEIEEFIMFAHGYVMNRLENEAPALILYPKIHKDHEKKSSKHKFWISNPMANRTKMNSSGEAEKYGGLM